MCKTNRGLDGCNVASFIPVLYQQVKHQLYLPHRSRMSRSLQFLRDKYNWFKRVSRYFQRYSYLIKFDDILLDSTEYNLIQDQAHFSKILSFEL